MKVHVLELHLYKINVQKSTIKMRIIVRHASELKYREKGKGTQ